MICNRREMANTAYAQGPIEFIPDTLLKQIFPEDSK